MITGIDDLLVTVIIALGALILLFIVWNLIVRRRKETYFHTPAALDDVSEAQIESGELRASLVSEEIEERVKQILKESGITLAEDLDFGTASDGSLRIWYGGKVYSRVEEIPDRAVREAVAKAVEKFNQ